MRGVWGWTASPIGVSARDRAREWRGSGAGTAEEDSVGIIAIALGMSDGRRGGERRARRDGAKSPPARRVFGGRDGERGIARESWLRMSDDEVFANVVEAGGARLGLEPIARDEPVVGHGRQRRWWRRLVVRGAARQEERQRAGADHFLDCRAARDERVQRKWQR